jgi:integral membrane protein (TIGR03766 family)
MKKIAQYFLERIDYLFLFFTILTLWGAFRSSNLSVSEMPNNFVFLLVIVVLFFFVVYSHPASKLISLSIFKKFFSSFKRNISLITLVVFVVIILLQVFILSDVTTAIGWDVGIIISNVNHPDKINGYLSDYPNNQLYYFIMYFYNKIVSIFLPTLNGNWLIFQMLNLVFIDTAAILLYKATKQLYGVKNAYLVFYLYMFLFMLSPWIMVPYTDQISLFLTTVVLYFYSKLKSISGITLFLTVIVIGTIIGISFLIKPSSIVYIIALAIVEVLKCCKESNFSFNTIIITSLILSSFFLPLVSFKYYMNNQDVVKIDSNRAMPWTHFVMMGLTGNGGYNFNDIKRDQAITDPILRKESNRDVIMQRLAEHKTAGYIKFLVQKHFNNTDRGDFGWGRDGTPQIPEKRSKNSIQTFLRDTYYQQGKKTNVLRFYMQIIWIVVLVGLMGSFKINSKKYDTLCGKLTIVGAFLYLLLFEGGRSRYLIQYLPFFLIVSSIGLTNILILFTNKTKRLNL